MSLVGPFFLSSSFFSPKLQICYFEQMLLIAKDLVQKLVHLLVFFGWANTVRLSRHLCQWRLFMVFLLPPPGLFFFLAEWIRSWCRDAEHDHVRERCISRLCCILYRPVWVLLSCLSFPSQACCLRGQLMSFVSPSPPVVPFPTPITPHYLGQANQRRKGV